MRIEVQVGSPPQRSDLGTRAGRRAGRNPDRSSGRSPALGLLLLFALGFVGCGVDWAARGVEEVPHPPTEAMEAKVRERTLELRSDLEEGLAGRDSDALAASFAAIGRHYHAHEIHDAALASYRNAVKLQPDDPAWRYLIGVASQAVGDLEGAAVAFEATIARSSSDPLPRVRLAEVRLAQSDPAAAESVLAEVVASRSDLALAHFFRGQALSALDRPDDALAAFERALEAQPQANSIHYEMALAARAAGRRELAEEHMARRGGVEVTIDDPVLSELNELNVGAVAHLRRGARAQVAGDWDGAIRHYRTAVESDPSNPEARQSLAGALARRGELDEAIEHYRAALAGDSGALPRTNLAGLLLTRGEVDEALKLVDEALALDPEAEHPLRVRAAALGASGRFDEAVAAYESLLARDEDQPELLLGLGRALAGQGDAVAAIRSLDRAIELDPDAFEAYFVRGNLLGQAGNYREAASSYRRVVEASPGYVPAWLGEITALALAGDLDEAAARAAAAAEANPDHPDLRLALEEVERRRAAAGKRESR